MSVLLVDSTVAIKWVVAEEYSDEATDLVQHAAGRRVRTVAPPHLSVEVINAIVRRTTSKGRSTGLTLEEAKQAVDVFLSFEISTVRSPGMYRRALELTRTHQLATIEESLYVALAEELKTPVWTADLQLQRLAETNSPLVRWIGDYTGPD